MNPSDYAICVCLHDLKTFLMCKKQIVSSLASVLFVVDESGYQNAVLLSMLRTEIPKQTGIAVMVIRDYLK